MNWDDSRLKTLDVSSGFRYPLIAYHLLLTRGVSRLGKRMPHVFTL